MSKGLPFDIELQPPRVVSEGGDSKNFFYIDMFCNKGYNLESLKNRHIYSSISSTQTEPFDSSKY